MQHFLSLNDSTNKKILRIALQVRVFTDKRLTSIYLSKMTILYKYHFKKKKNLCFNSGCNDKCIKIDFEIRDVKGFSFPLVISTSDL